MSSSPLPPPLLPEDLAFLESLREGGNWLRAILSTLARRGVAFRKAESERTRALLDALAPYPWYKGGQFLFDLMEWEDFMLDGPPPPLIATVLDAAALSRLANALDQVKASLDGATEPASFRISGSASLTIPSEHLPELESGMFLYEDVVLGVVLTLLPSFAIRY